MPSFRRIRPRSGPYRGQKVRCYCLCSHDGLITWHIAKGKGASKDRQPQDCLP